MTNILSQAFANETCYILRGCSKSMFFPIGIAGNACLELEYNYGMRVMNVNTKDTKFLYQSISRAIDALEVNILMGAIVQFLVSSLKHLYSKYHIVSSPRPPNMTVGYLIDYIAFNECNGST